MSESEVFQGSLYIRPASERIATVHPDGRVEWRPGLTDAEKIDALARAIAGAPQPAPSHGAAR